MIINIRNFTDALLLYYHGVNPQIQNKKMGPGWDTFLAADEELEIVECLKIMARWGFGFIQNEGTPCQRICTVKAKQPI